MQFSATNIALAAAALLASPVIAGFDSLACGGMGACTAPGGCNYFNYEMGPGPDEWNCGTGGNITYQQGAGLSLKAGRGLLDGTPVSRAEFPKCDLIQPSADAVLIKTTYDGGVTHFGWIEYTCTETTPITDACYNRRRNPSTYYTCKVYKNGQTCTHLDKGLVKEGSCPK